MLGSLLIPNLLRFELVPANFEAPWSNNTSPLHKYNTQRQRQRQRQRQTRPSIPPTTKQPHPIHNNVHQEPPHPPPPASPLPSALSTANLTPPPPSPFAPKIQHASPPRLLLLVLFECREYREYREYRDAESVPDGLGSGGQGQERDKQRAVQGVRGPVQGVIDGWTGAQWRAR